LTFHGLTIYEAYLNNVNCMKFGQLILRKIIKTVATGCHILSQNAINSISAGALTQTRLEELTSLPQTS